MAKERSQKVQYLAVLCVSIGTMTLGATAAWTTPAFVKFNNNETNFEVTKEDFSWMAAVNNPGFILGSLLTGYILDAFGRRISVLGSSAPYAIGSFLVAFGDKAWLLCVARFLWGVGTGMISTVIGIYVAEISDKEIRGRLSVGTKLMTNLGNLLAMGIWPMVSYNAMNYMVLVLPLVQFFACTWIPESPYYLLKQDKVKKATKELARIRGYKDDSALQDELTSLQSSVNKEMRRSTSFWEFIHGKRYRMSIIIAIGLKVTQVMTGLGTIKQYLGKIVNIKGSPKEVSFMLLIFGIVEFLVSFTSSVLVDRVGRRPLLFYSYIGTGFSLGVVALYFLLEEIIKIPEENLSPYRVLTFLGILSANVISSIGFNSIIFVIYSEIFAMNVKAVAMASLSVLGGIFGFIVSKGFQLVIDVSGFFGAFTIFSVIAFSGAIFVFFLVPEMKGKTLEEVQKTLQGDLYDDEKQTGLTVGVNALNEDSNVAKENQNKESLL